MDNASPLPRLAAPLAPAGSSRLPSPALGLFRMPEGYVLLSRDGAFFSTDLAGTEQVMRFGGAPVHEDFDDGPPRIFEAAGMLFAFWRGDRDQWFTRDGTTWDRLPLPAFHDRRRLDWRGVLETPDGLCAWASYTRDNAEIGFGDDLIYDSYVVGAALFEGPDPERLAFTGTFEDCFDRYTVTGLACAKGRLAALCASEPPRKGSLVCAFRDAGGAFQPAAPMDIEDYGVSVRDYKINFAYNRTKLYAFQDRLYARGRSLYEVDPATGVLADVHPTRVPNSFEYVKEFAGVLYYRGTALWTSADMVRWEIFCEDASFGQSFVVEGNRFTAVAADGTVLRSRLA